MTDVKSLITTAERNFGVLKREVEGLTHADSLVQPPFRGNCLNWVVGHVTQSRDKMLQALGEASVWTAEQIDRYERESEPITADMPGVIPFEQMMADLAITQERLLGALKRCEQTTLDTRAPEVIKGLPEWSIGETLAFLLWHETYHVGQTNLLRQVAGKNDKTI
ncbi:MAG: DinB family protein [Anaerolineae bacterium]|nr:DinB family protein [Anaerolineae bacterium]